MKVSTPSRMTSFICVDYKRPQQPQADTPSNMSTSSLLLLLLSLCGSCYCFCPESWVQSGSSCYFYNQQPLPWVEAQVVCNLLDGHLAEITSAAENTAVVNLLASRQSPSAWIGINDMVIDGRWVLTSSRQRLVYTNWDNGEPNNYRGVREDCGVIVRSGFWNDVTCAPTTLFSSVCEKSA